MPPPTGKTARCAAPGRRLAASLTARVDGAAPRTPDRPSPHSGAEASCTSAKCWLSWQPALLGHHRAVDERAEGAARRAVESALRKPLDDGLTRRDVRTGPARR